ncbi:DNA polymerase III subunit alpha [Candidatus Palibaumannia cicadellinicola]|uniref:DNA polymerase III subunit alpha n=1 Tax=Baumannia cicadellinicola subsp. Homalodisca coagulata TaxID=374463 RepID=Q1LSU6_BAUCH|nr:DNA polymerase III subunit alpha [Candidatus Baumannia cicadellinicola]ABF13776.1 DNA polymerase III, alpha subunit [Baumannia cicadellinicola str. Hc (Homalodisca coagulata)]MCJ7462170.1 DNA polymerase III subunit alpha [Candidatus Baumannia cicadellinicola]MCJ7463004.1 DNA polymerase III subunit alpha [Candidatus Baumannia cicadellinicola]
MIEPSFIHLRIHSDYSIIDGLIKVSSLVKKAVSLNMPALALTDVTNLYGIIKFYKAANSVGIKPIIGADFLMYNPILGGELTELTILATNYIGYQCLTMLISQAYRRGYGAAGPVIDRDWLIQHNQGLIILSGARKGDVGKLLLNDKMQQVKKCLAFYHRYFPDRYYLELIRTGRLNEEKYLNLAVLLAKKNGLPVVATNDVRFISSDDFQAHNIRVAIHNGCLLDNVKQSYDYSSQQYIRSEQEMCELFKDIPEALANSVEIAIRCNVTIRLGEYFLPQFYTGNISTNSYLIKCARQGLEERLAFLFPDLIQLKDNRLPYDQRLDQELQVINGMGFPGYFLIVMEFIQWSKDNSIPVGPGRGSGAGSLVAYALKITDINPLPFDLLFERFLNPERISMPDFDIDFCMEKRDLVINHVAETYGRDAVSQIITFGTMAAKAVIRDVGRVLGYPYSFVNKISKLVPHDPGITLDKALAIAPQLRQIYNVDENVTLLIDLARKLEGVTRNVGKHAGGVVIAPTKITDFAPLYYDSEGKCPLTQFDKNDIEYAGLVKFDFLGLRTLTIINRALEMINKHIHSKLNPIEITTIPLDDKKSFDMLLCADTTAIFQLESRGIKELIRRLQPDCFEDIIALIALFRPGPLQSGMVDNFINRKHGRETICYPDIQWQHPSLQPILEPTYGIILYQEQVMQIARILAGYTLGEADLLRRAMGKKEPKEMVKQRAIFKIGAEKMGIESKLAMKIFDLVEKFAGYGFNKSHSTAYALVSYQTLWLKAHYPSQFMASAMTADIDNIDKLAILVYECLRMGITVLPPNINISHYYFHVNKNSQIIYGLGAIKGLGEGPITTILEARNTGGKFSNLLDLCIRTCTKKLNRRILEKLIISGACDQLGSHRAALMNELETALKTADQYTKLNMIGQIDMFSTQADKQCILDYSHKSKNIQPWSKQVILKGEQETLGLYLTSHPIIEYLYEIKFYTKGLRLKDIPLITCSKKITVVGLLLSIRNIITNNNQSLSICTIDDMTGHLDIAISSDMLDQYKSFLKVDNILLVEGEVRFSNTQSTLKVIAHKIMDINTARNKYAAGIAIFLTAQQINESFLKNLDLSLKSHALEAGAIPVHLYYNKNNTRVQLHYNITWKVKLTDYLLNDLRNLVGNEGIKIEFN